jgi:hypothetical protein
MNNDGRIRFVGGLLHNQVLELNHWPDVYRHDIMPSEPVFIGGGPDIMKQSQSVSSELYQLTKMSLHVAIFFEYHLIDSGEVDHDISLHA